MAPPPSVFVTLSSRAQASWVVVAATAFHLGQEFKAGAPLLLVFLFAILRLAYLPLNRVAVVGTSLGLLIYAPQLGFFWNIFGPGALALWFVLAFFLILFLLLQRRAILLFGPVFGPLSAPVLWMGLEYARSELYYLRFSWLSIGYSFPDQVSRIGIYGVGFLLMAIAALVAVSLEKRSWTSRAAAAGLLGFLCFPKGGEAPVSSLKIAGVQWEFPAEGEVISALDQLAAKYPDTPLFVLSEYTFSDSVPKRVLEWCASHQRYLIVGGREVLGPGANNFYNTAFVIGPNGKEIFRQVKAVPVQLMLDGKPAPEQKVWASPWGVVGIGTCYDLSYARVMDPLIRQGAQVLIIPTMDAEDWGRNEHELHAKVAPVRAAEYHVPIFRLASSGISQAVTGKGEVIASAPFPGQGESLGATLHLPPRARLPLDRWIVWPCVSFVFLIFGWNTVISWQTRPRPQAVLETPEMTV